MKRGIDVCEREHSCEADQVEDLSFQVDGKSLLEVRHVDLEEILLEELDAERLFGEP